MEARFSSNLSVDERQQAAKFRFAQDRLRFIVARGGLRWLLGKYLRRPPEDLAFVVNRFGKPRLQRLTDEPDLRFNTSHSGNVVALVFGLRMELGIDVEQVREIREMEAVAQACLSPPQFVSFRQLRRGVARTKAFYRFWTRKEALIKALGMGLSQPLREFDVTFHHQEPPQLLRAASGFGDVGNWTLSDVVMPENYQAAVAVHGRPRSLHAFAWAM